MRKIDMIIVWHRDRFRRLSQRQDTKAGVIPQNPDGVGEGKVALSPLHCPLEVRGQSCDTGH
jgi:hypothetical protein